MHTAAGEERADADAPDRAHAPARREPPRAGAPGGPAARPAGGAAGGPAEGGPADGPPAAAAREVGGYRLVRRIGSGGMGEVHEALDGEGHRVALKILHPHVARDPASRARLAREVSLLHRVRAEGVARVIDAEVEDTEAFVVTELVDGATLDADVAEHGAFSAEEIPALAHGLADALRSIHDAGIVHRDLKPGNVMLARTGPVLIDFGIAQVVDDERLTQTGLVTGTPGYLDPEVLAGAEPSPACDWWAWAAVLVFAATSRPPFGKGLTAAVLGRVATGRVDLAGMEPMLARALGAALSPDPAHRLPAETVLEVVDGTITEDALEDRIAALARRAPTSAAHAVLPADGGPTVPMHAPADGGPTTHVPPAGGVPGHAPARTDRLPTAVEAWDSGPRGPGTVGVWPTAGAVDGAAGSGPTPGGAPSPGAAPARGPARSAGSDRYGVPAGGSPYANQAAPPYAGPGVGTSAYGHPGGTVDPTARHRGPDGRAPAWALPPARRTGIAAAAGLALASLAAHVPGWFLLVLVASSVLLATWGQAAGALRRTRLRRGPRAGDAGRTVLALPWHLVLGVLSTSIGIVIGLVLASSAVLGAELLTGEPAGPPVLLAAGVLGVAGVWLAPTSGNAREGLRLAVSTVARGALARVVLLAALLAVAAVAVGLVVTGADVTPRWGPLPDLAELGRI